MKTHSLTIKKALAATGGHMFIGHNSWFIVYDKNSSVTGADEGPKAEAIEAGLPVIDASKCDLTKFNQTGRLVPIVSVNDMVDPEPWGPLNFAPLEHVAKMWREIGAETHNI